ncbi:GAF and ANTAR domain-containing protein [Amycolatopsis sp. CA-126428]|uniref:GAF and ANTAR domain-containing protein n=1 Tax=Amycolatopsis sp. CA-126428 TaxID=2073158 RepID=UPI001E4AFBCE|nr:GAF and ANTAR domain-containing protein [Amycolatopsis sp. CA-126428]
MQDGVHTAVLLEPDALNAKILHSSLPDGTLPVHASVEEALADAPARGGERHLGAQLAELTRILLDATSVSQALQHVVAATTVVIPHARLVSITLRDPGGRFFTPVEIPDIAADLDDVQYRTGSGPCLDAARPDGPAYSLDQDLSRTSAWPQFAAVATAHGLNAVLSTALLPAQRAGVGGALNIYAHRGGITETDRHCALLLATHASLALQQARGAEIADLERTHLHRAIASRDVIGQAKGILMARQGIDADAAFRLLRRASQDLNVKLADIAAALVRNHTTLAPRRRRVTPPKESSCRPGRDRRSAPAEARLPGSACLTHSPVVSNPAAPPSPAARRPPPRGGPGRPTFKPCRHPRSRAQWPPQPLATCRNKTARTG